MTNTSRKIVRYLNSIGETCTAEYNGSADNDLIRESVRHDFHDFYKGISITTIIRATDNDAF